MGGGPRLWAAALLAALTIPASATPTRLRLETVRGSTLEMLDGKLVVGLNDGGIAAFEPGNGSLIFANRSAERLPVRNIVSAGNHVWWITGESSILHVSSEDGVATNIDLSQIGLGSPIRRLGVWRGLVAVHGDAGVRFVDPRTQSVMPAEQILPRDVAEVVAQGVMLSSWQGNAGMLVAIRRYGKKPSTGEDIAMLTAWSFDADGGHHLLGAYCGPLVKFQDASGPHVRIDIGDLHIDNPRGVADVANLRIGPEGVLATTRKGVLTIPFFKNNWMPSTVTTTLGPNEAASFTYSGATVWWATSDRVMQASLEDGDTDVYVPQGRQGKILGLASDDEVAYALTESGISRIGAAASGYLRVSLTTKTAPGRLTTALDKFRALPAESRRRLADPDALRRFLKAQKVAVRPQALRADLGELKIGDLVTQAGQRCLYIGGRSLLSFQGGEKPLDPELPLEAIRLVAPSTLAVDGRRGLLSGISPIGLGSPDGDSGLCCVANPDSPEDSPTGELQQQLAGMLDAWIGVPYRWGGSTMDGTDCSGLVNTLFAQLGIKLPRHSQDIGRAPVGEIVTGELHFGDVLVFPHPKHCAIYVGHGRIIEAIHGGVTYSSLRRYKRAVVRRFLN